MNKNKIELFKHTLDTWRNYLIAVECCYSDFGCYYYNVHMDCVDRIKRRGWYEEYEDWITTGSFADG